MATWPDGPGVVDLPSGRRVRGRGLRRAAASDSPPTFGVYLLARPPDLTWPHRWVRCRDFRSPADADEAVSALREALERAGRERVEVGCWGGVGRTGIALSLLAILDGLDADDAVGWVRSRYHPRAVETLWQRRWVVRVGRELGDR